jgi:hypothetical protein
MGSGYGGVWNSANASQTKSWSKPFALPPGDRIGTAKQHTRHDTSCILTHRILRLIDAPTYATSLCAVNSGSGSGFTAATVQVSCGELVAVFYINLSGSLGYSLVIPPAMSSGSPSYSLPASVNGTGNILQPTGVYFKRAVWVYYIDVASGLVQYVNATTSCS